MVKKGKEDKMKTKELTVIADKSRRDSGKAFLSWLTDSLKAKKMNMTMLSQMSGIAYSTIRYWFKQQRTPHRLYQDRVRQLFQELEKIK